MGKEFRVWKRELTKDLYHNNLRKKCQWTQWTTVYKGDSQRDDKMDCSVWPLAVKRSKHTNPPVNIYQ